MRLARAGNGFLISLLAFNAASCARQEQSAVLESTGKVAASFSADEFTDLISSKVAELERSSELAKDNPIDAVYAELKANKNLSVVIDGVKISIDQKDIANIKKEDLADLKKYKDMKTLVSDFRAIDPVELRQKISELIHSKPSAQLNLLDSLSGAKCLYGVGSAAVTGVMAGATLAQLIACPFTAGITCVTAGLSVAGTAAAGAYTAKTGAANIRQNCNQPVSSADAKRVAASRGFR